MKKLLIALVCVLCLTVISCGGEKYDFDTAERLMEKIEKDEPLTRDEYDTAIDLLEEGYEYDISFKQKYSPAEIIQKMNEDEDYATVLANTATIHIMLAFSGAYLTPAQLERFTELAERYDSIIND